MCCVRDCRGICPAAALQVSQSGGDGSGGSPRRPEAMGLQTVCLGQAGGGPGAARTALHVDVEGFGFHGTTAVFTVGT